VVIFALMGFVAWRERGWRFLSGWLTGWIGVSVEVGVMMLGTYHVRDDRLDVDCRPVWLLMMRKVR